MTYHIRLPGYECKNCKTMFMAYSKGVECPKCNKPEESGGETYDFVGITAWSMSFNKKKYKRYTPDAWYSGSYGEAVQGSIFRAFDYAKQNPNMSWGERVKGITLEDGDGNKFTNERYLVDLLTAVEKEFNLTPKERKIKQEISDKKFKADEQKEIEDRKLRNRIKKFIMSFTNFK